MTIEELRSLLGALPGGRRVPSLPPLDSAFMVAGIEVAFTAHAGERVLRRLWNERHGASATPVVLLTSDRDRPTSVMALGVSDPAAPLRSVDAAALFEVLRRVAPRARLDAVRELNAELGRLDQAGIPGLVVRELLTHHTLDARLRHDPARWARAREVASAVPSKVDWRTVLTALGYTLERRQPRGYLARSGGRPVAVVHPKADPAEFSRLDRDGRPPEGTLLNDCEADGAPFGMLATGSRLRLFQVAPVTGSSAAHYLDIDASILQDDDRPFLALLGPDSLGSGGFGDLQDEARRFGADLRRRLDDTIRQSVLPALGRALGRWATGQGKDLADDAVRRELERAALTLVFRVLFVLYAESAGHLPMDNRSYRQASLSSLVEEAAEARDRLGERSTTLWDSLMLLVRAMRNGNPAWGVPAYNGALFAPDGFDGAATLERASISDPDVATILVGLGRDPETDGGTDYSSLEIGHLGYIYEGLLSLHLSVADVPLRYDPRDDRYVTPGPGERADVEPGDLLWQTNAGGRKTGGVYYTPSTLVRHLVRQAVIPSFQEHLDRVRKRAADDPAAAARELLGFAVLDPACGSAHFLAVVVNELADRLVRFLGEVPLPEIRAAVERLRAGMLVGASVDDVALLRRLVLKWSVFGVDVNPMGAEIAKLSLWLASFVPGLSLAYLERNVVVGNSLLGVMRPEAVHPSAGQAQRSFLGEQLASALQRAAEAAQRVAVGDDRTPDEVEASAAADRQAHDATAGMERLFDLWTAEPFGVARAREQVDLHGSDVIAGKVNDVIERARAAAAEHGFLHWPLAFPTVFARERPGFDAVVGNPPWNEVTVEEQSFYALFRPGIRRGIPDAERARAVAKLVAERPELPDMLAREQARVAVERKALAAGEYQAMPGDPDLYKYFCQRYQGLLRDGGTLGVVLPRTTFVNRGSESFRAWLFESSTCRRIDFLVNAGRWAFDAEPRYTVALVVASKAPPSPGHRTRIAGPATSAAKWEAQILGEGYALSPEAYGPHWAPPLLGTQKQADLLVKLRTGSRFPFGAGRWRCFPVREFDATQDRRLWRGATAGWPLWKGASFDQYLPRGDGAVPCPASEEALAKARKPRPGAGSLLAGEVPVRERAAAVAREIGAARVVFGDVTQKDNSRTVVACLVPPKVFLTNTAPYLTFVAGDNRARAACLGVMNSLPFDWQARRFAEVHVNFFILESLVVPELDDGDFDAVATAAARLSCVDERLAEFAESVGVAAGPLDDEERERLRVEIDAHVARAWGLDGDDLAVVFADFTRRAVPDTYRRRLAGRLAELG